MLALVNSKHALSGFSAAATAGIGLDHLSNVSLEQHCLLALNVSGNICQVKVSMVVVVVDGGRERDKSENRV